MHDGSISFALQAKRAELLATDSHKLGPQQDEILEKLVSLAQIVPFWNHVRGVGASAADDDCLGVRDDKDLGPAQQPVFRIRRRRCK